MFGPVNILAVRKPASCLLPAPLLFSTIFYCEKKKKKRKKENPRNYCIMYNVCSVQGGSLLSLIDIARAVWNMWHKKKSRRLFTPSLCRGAASERLNVTTVGDSRVDEEIPFHLFILSRLERERERPLAKYPIAGAAKLCL